MLGEKPGDGGKFSENPLTIRGTSLVFHTAKLSYFNPKIRVASLVLGKPL